MAQLHDRRALIGIAIHRLVRPRIDPAIPSLSPCDYVRRRCHGLAVTTLDFSVE